MLKSKTSNLWLTLMFKQQSLKSIQLDILKSSKKYNTELNSFREKDTVAQDVCTFR